LSGYIRVDGRVYSWEQMPWDNEENGFIHLCTVALK
jgi:hypothetical protein